MPRHLVCLLLALWGLSSCKEDSPSGDERSDDFQSTPQSFPVAAGTVDEASGLADSRTIDGYLWTHQDSGYPSELFLISKDAKTIKKFPVSGTSYLDWEDIAAGPGPEEGKSYLYIADIGANAHPNRPTCVINRVKEPSGINESFPAVEQLIFRYPDGTKDAETLLVDPVTRDLYVVTKETTRARLYRLPYPQPVNSEFTAEFAGEIPGIKDTSLPPTLYTSPTSGDISFDGKEIIIKTYTTIFYWKRGNDETVPQALSKKPLKTLPYLLEPEGTAICFDKRAEGYFSLSEIAKSQEVSLNYYRRK